MAFNMINTFTESSKACIVLSNGRVFWGKSFGIQGVSAGEAVFTTGMCGYIETLTDPSYFGQIVIQTFPLIGNYGVIPKDFESPVCALRGYVVRSWCEVPSNFRSEMTLDAYLKAQNIAGLYDVDTRALAKALRENGVMNSMIISGDSEEAKCAFSALEKQEAKASLLERINSYAIKGAVESVSCKACSTKTSGNSAGNKKKVVLWDFGAKANIQRELLRRGSDVLMMPCSASAAEIAALKPDGIVLSNGPGDPQDNKRIIGELKELMSFNIPLFGICLGHQMMALAAGANTVKLRYGHRGVNQPVRDTKTGRVYITSQNHGYAVKPDSLPDNAAMSFINTNDGTCEGIEYKGMPAFSVQFHPEAAAGPHDTDFLFDDFMRLIEGAGSPKTFKEASCR